MNNLSYELEDTEQTPMFTHFIPNDELKKHLYILKETHPRNNILYNFMLWIGRTKE